MLDIVKHFQVSFDGSYYERGGVKIVELNFFTESKGYTDEDIRMINALMPLDQYKVDEGYQIITALQKGVS